jgi:hypothetical protein
MAADSGQSARKGRYASPGLASMTQNAQSGGKNHGRQDKTHLYKSSSKPKKSFYYNMLANIDLFLWKFFSV